MALPGDERRELRDLLDESLANEGDYDLTDAEWLDIERELEAYRQGTLSTVPARDVFARIRAKYGL